jgi:hypothetical protein
MMDDFTRDLDLLDDLFGSDPTIDWVKLEPTLSLHSPPSPMDEIATPPSSFNLQPLTPESIPSPGNGGMQAKTSTPLKKIPTPIQPNNVQTAQKTQQMQFTQITGFGIPFTPMYGNAVILPQLSLAMTVDGGEKLPVKRLEKEGGTGHGNGRKKEVNRRSSHNAIERRYRSSINDKIIELKNLVCASPDPNEKVHKAAVLRSSIDTIRYLQGSNSRLEKENRALKKSRKCPNCGGDTLRDLLSTPPPTEGEDSSNPPSPADSTKSSGKSPLALFAIAAGLFLVNPVSLSDFHISSSSESLGHGSRVEQPADIEQARLSYNKDYYTIWMNRLGALAVNLFLFCFVYFLSGKIGKGGARKKYSNENIQILRKKINPKLSNNEKKRELEIILSQFDKIPNNPFSCMLSVIMEICKLPYSLMKRNGGIHREMKEDISKLYLEYGRVGGNHFWSALKSFNYSPVNEELIISSIILSKSKMLLRFVLLFKTFETHPLGTKLGLPFLMSSIGTPIAYAGIMCDPSENNDLAELLCKFKEDMLHRGIAELFQFGQGRIYLKAALQAGRIDKTCQFWAGIFWAEAELLRAGGQKEILERLYKLIDSVWPLQKELALSRAVYFAHMAKRNSSRIAICKQFLDLAAVNLRDSINTPTDEPSKVIQNIWCLVAEWILETRLLIWEETKERDGFSKDLDTLRSLTHYVPAILSSVYLYEACQRLMNQAAPGRTQQLLDASLRQVRVSQRALICTGEDELSCKGRKQDINLVREKRKAMALYLKCKHLPSQVITCPGEKAGMLREALKALEKIGEKKRISECLEMIRALGQSVTLH